MECERCGECGAPAGVSGIFEWDGESCRIEERSSGRRYCFNNTSGISAVLGMLVEELGEDIEHRMVGIAREYARSLYEDMAAKAEGSGGIDLAAQLDGFPYRGWGKVTGLSDRGDMWVVAVDNPYNEIMLSGRIWGLLEASSGRELQVSVREADGTALRLELRP